jgi:hypothetical protein
LGCAACAGDMPAEWARFKQNPQSENKGCESGRLAGGHKAGDLVGPRERVGQQAAF